jgi:hypothetical protein
MTFEKIDGLSLRALLEREGDSSILNPSCSRLAHSRSERWLLLIRLVYRDVIEYTH